jgi:hypothetical protein
MMSFLANLFTNETGRKQKLNRAFWWTLGVIFILQLYFVRELLAAELLFGMVFAVVFSIGFVLYVIGRAGERGFNWAEQAARRGLVAVQELSRRPFRHPRSESAQ